MLGFEKIIDIQGLASVDKNISEKYGKRGGGGEVKGEVGCAKIP